MERFRTRSAVIGSLALSALFTYSGAAVALGSLGATLNTKCASRGGVPAQPYNAGNCTQCHDDGTGGAGAGKTAYLASNWDYFCPVAAANATPVADLQLSLVNDWAGIVGVPLKIPLAAADAQGKPLFFSVSGLPAGLALADSGNGSGNIAGTPQVAGRFTPTVTVVDNSAPVRSDVQTFALVVTYSTQPPAAGVEYQTKAIASWQREAKQLRVRGRVLPVVDNAGDTERTNRCMPLAGKALTVTNEKGKTVLNGALDCRGGYQLQGLVNILDTSCTMTVAVAGAPSTSANVRGAPGCKDVGKRDQEQEHGDTRRTHRVNGDENHD